ncbi:hypothetical protein SMACR_02850 [Sordaria macrospora]|uniref:Zn(2)-C6 fungal-type domain-containing protein n=1 Tax=Sordaria macrospora TaxID=5147 RepID=A0A8S8ZW83_SORMA|nr:hypothetical protein SMACR_02850 [Sordaria macrospora]WPJ58204.1 hypothetical protein SMAC4_02850 [Sordaria macrospora]
MTMTRTPEPAQGGSSSPDEHTSALTNSASLRRLLPVGSEESLSRPLAPARSSASTSPSSTTTGRTTLTKTQARSAVPTGRSKRQATTAACGACRRRKSKCNGERPKCSACHDRGTDCEYDTNVAETHAQALKRKYDELQSSKSAAEKVFEILQTKDEKEAGEVFQRIRRGADPATILRHITFGDALIQLALAPDTGYRYEFPYLPGMPAFLQRHDNVYLDSEVYACVLRRSAPGPSAVSVEHRQQLACQLLSGSQQQPYFTPSNASRSMSPYLAHGPAVDLHSDPYHKPYHAASVENSRLEKLQPSQWTSVSTDDNLMRKFLHDYIMYDYGWNHFLHLDYFLDDMANGRHRFCSRLLVNTILCIGSYHHRGLHGRAEYWNPANIVYMFLAEAKRLFEIDSELERPIPMLNDPHGERRLREWEERRLTTIQAGLLLNVLYLFNGSDKIGWRYSLRAIDMAHEINLFGAAQPEMDREMRNVREFTAWIVFTWQSINSYHYFRAPIMRHPPQVPLPDPIENPQWYGEIWVKYPGSQSRFPTHLGFMFKAKAQLWTIMNDLSLLSFRDGGLPLKMSSSQVLEFYNRLVNWLHQLPEPLSPRKIVTPHQMKLHMHFYFILINMLRPIVTSEWRNGIPPGKTIPPCTPHDAYLNATILFETLIRIYYLRHGFEALDSFLMQFLGALAYMTIDAIAQNPSAPHVETLRSTALLATKGMWEQAQSLYVARAVLRLLASAMRPEDVQLLKKFANVEAETDIYAAPLEQPVQSDWPTYVVRLDQNPDTVRLGKTLSSKLERLSLDLTASSPPVESTPRPRNWSVIL